MRPAQLWRSRYGRFWREHLHYILYALQSGLAFTLIALFIIGSYLYASLYNHLPANFPAVPIAIIALLPMIAYSPVRTMLREADMLFLLPTQHTLKPFFRMAKLVAYARQAILALAVWTIYWPLFRLATDNSIEMYFWMILVILLLKLANLYGGWKEDQLRDASWRISFTLLRWVITGLILYSLLVFPLLRALPFIMLVLILYRLALRLPASLPFHWLRHIEREQQMRSRQLRFFSWFVDVPSVSGRPVRRLWADSIEALPFTLRNAYTYLYLKVYFRSEFFSMHVRMLILSVAGIAWLQNDLVIIAIFLIVCWLTAVQLSGLEQVYRYSDWQHVYPLPQQLRTDSLARLNMVTHMLGLVPVALITAFSLQFGLVLLLIGGWVCFSIVYHLVLQRRKWRKLYVDAL